MKYSQNDEERIISGYFSEFVGSFLSLGENDGQTLSNVRALAEKGWAGVCVEPSPAAYAKLKELYPKGSKVYTYPYALGKTNGMVKMWDSGEHLGKGDTGLLSTMTDADHEKWKASTQFTEIEVQCFRWKTFLNRLSIKTFDFISIDIEGQDLDVLKQIDLTNTRMVCVEWNGKQKDEFTEVCRGFTLVHENSENLIFAR